MISKSRKIYLRLTTVTIELNKDDLFTVVKSLKADES